MARAKPKSKSKPKPKPKRADPLAGHVAGLPRALAPLVKLARTYGAELDYSWESLDRVEALWYRVVDEKLRKPRDFDKLWTWYVFETLAQRVGGKWVVSTRRWNKGQPVIGKIPGLSRSYQVHSNYFALGEKKQYRSAAGHLRYQMSRYDLAATRREHDHFMEAIPDLLVTLEGESRMQLDYTLDSLDVLERFLLEKPRSYYIPRDRIVLDAACAYVGELVRRHKPLSWVMIDDPNHYGAFGRSGLDTPGAHRWVPYEAVVPARNVFYGSGAANPRRVTEALLETL